MIPGAALETLLGAVDPGRPRTLLGIAGAPGAGKSTLAAAGAAALAARGVPAAVLPMDGFHLPQARLVELGRRERMGAPDTFDVAGFVAALEAVRDPAATVRLPLFDRDAEEPVPGALEIGPAVRVVLVEGNYLLHDAGGWERVAPLLDAVARIRISPGLRRERLRARHVAFGKPPADAEAWTLGPDERNAGLVERDLERASGPALWIDLG